MTSLCHGTLASASASALQGVALALALESVALLTSLPEIGLNGKCKVLHSRALLTGEGRS